MRINNKKVLLKGGQILDIDGIKIECFLQKKAHDSNAPYDGCDEPDDTGQNAKSGYLKGVG